MQGVATPCARPGSAPTRPFLHVCRSDLATRRRGGPLTHVALNHEPNTRYAELKPSLLVAHHKRSRTGTTTSPFVNRAHRLRGRGPDCSRRPCTLFAKGQVLRHVAVPAADGRLLLGIAPTGTLSVLTRAKPSGGEASPCHGLANTSAFSAKVSLPSKRLKARLMSRGPLSAGSLKPRCFPWFAQSGHLAAGTPGIFTRVRIAQELSLGGQSGG